MLIYKYTQPGPLEGTRPAQPGANASAARSSAQGEDLFGPAYVRETGAKEEEVLTVYTSDARMAGSLKKKEKGVDGKELSEHDEALLQKLQARDAKVRSHEAAHVMAAGGQASSPTYTYQTGPDGKRYAIGGSVNISIMTTGDSEADARRAKKAYRAAMATGEPSSRDMQTATLAQEMSARAMREGTEKYAAAQNGIY